MALVLTAAAAVLAAALWLLLAWRGRAARLLRRVPGPPAWPLLGNALHYAVPPDKMFAVMRALQQQYGPLNQIHGLSARMVNVSNPDDVEKITSSPEYNVKKDPYTFVLPWLNQGLLVSKGKKWQQRRKMLTKAFHFNVLLKFLEIFKDRMEDFVKRVEKENANDKTDVLALVSPTALRIMCETSMGLTLGEETPAMRKYFKSIFDIGECFALRLSKVWLHNDFLFNLTSISRRQKRILADLHEFTTNVIKERRALLERRDVDGEGKSSDASESREKLAMLDLLIENEKLGIIDDEGIREEVDTFMFEGFDTSSVTLTFTIMALANEPEVQDKIYEEMQRIFGDSKRLPTMDDVNEMKYLECCLKESMRLYPAAPMIARHLLKDTVLSGYTVPAGTDVYLCIFDMQRRADLFPEPARFRPERFLAEPQRGAYAYIPFSAGQRNCIGQKFAMLELKVILSSLFRKFRVEPVTTPSDLVFKMDIVLRTTQPIYARFRLRE